ncbi:MAG TPA: sensor histidine kinase, partial [Candidatus Sumerlaeota bacterium]|nr:sensor histidine kinase [Candidatus Sumerlaeota bacterium]
DNLVSNALKFSPKGRIVKVRLTARADGALFEITDQGPGMSAEDKEKMFKKFQRLSARPTAGESSTGLGLAIVHALVGRMRGRIEVESEVGVGTVFRVWLPLV